MTQFDTIRNDGRLLYEYIRGSHLYGLNNENSDIDTSGVFVCTKNNKFITMYNREFTPERNSELKPNVVFFHGKENGPNGTKIKRFLEEMN